MWRGCLDGVWRLSNRCQEVDLEGVVRLSGGVEEAVTRVSGSCLECVGRL